MAKKTQEQKPVRVEVRRLERLETTAANPAGS